MSFLVSGPETLSLRLDLNLQEVNRVRIGMIELAVMHSGSCAHSLDISRSDNRTVSPVVFVLQGAFYNVGDDLHVLVWMCSESPAGFHPVLVNYPKRTESHVRGIMILTERERMAAVKLSDLRHVSLIGFPADQS